MNKLITICLLLATTFFAKAQESFSMDTYEENGKVGLLDDKGGKITAAKYDKEVYAPDSTYLGTFTATFNEGLCSVYLNQKVGFIDKKGTEVIPLEFSSVHEFTVEGLAAVEKEGKWGFVNKKGKQSIPIIYNKVFDFEKGKSLVIKENSVYFIDLNGEEIYPSYTIWQGYNENNLTIIQNSIQEYGFLYKNRIYPNFYDEIFFSELEFIVVESNTKIGIMNRSAKEIIPPIYDEITSFDGKYFYFFKNHKMGIIDIENNIISPFIYGSLNPFKEGLSRVKLDLVFIPDKSKYEDERYGFIDENGKEVIPRIYDYATDFANDRAEVTIGDDVFFINKKGERIK